MNFPLHLAIWPWLLVDLSVGFAIGIWIKGAIWRIVTWLFIPIIVALISSSNFANVFTDTGESGGWAKIDLMLLVVSGFPVFGVGILTGYFLRRITKRK